LTRPFYLIWFSVLTFLLVDQLILSCASDLQALWFFWLCHPFNFADWLIISLGLLAMLVTSGLRTLPCSFFWGQNRYSICVDSLVFADVQLISECALWYRNKLFFHCICGRSYGMQYSMVSWLFLMF
jgi:hypothetical protein